MENTEILGAVKDVIAQKQLELEVDILPDNFIQKWLMKKGIIPKKKIVTIHPANLVTLVNISTEILKLPGDIFKSNNILNENYALMRDHIPTMSRIVAMS